MRCLFCDCPEIPPMDSCGISKCPDCERLNNCPVVGIFKEMSAQQAQATPQLSWTLSDVLGAGATVLLVLFGGPLVLLVLGWFIQLVSS
jgi:hypothetical protein